MLISSRTILAAMILLALSPVMIVIGAEQITIVVDTEASPRVRFGAERLNQTLVQLGYNTSVVSPATQSGDGRRIILRTAKNTTGQNREDDRKFQLGFPFSAALQRLWHSAAALPNPAHDCLRDHDMK